MGVVAGLLLLASSAVAQLNIEWQAVAGGGGGSTGGVYTVSGTIGQSDASEQALSGGNFSLVGGFWSIYVVQTSGAPRLRLFRSTPDTVVLAWPSASSGWSLVQNNNLATTTWTTVTNTVNVVGGEYQVAVPRQAGNRFFRLTK